MAVAPVVALIAWLAFGSSNDDAQAARRDVPVDAHLDLGPYTDVAMREYRVQAGDTLGHIAQREIGSVRHVSSLRRWNPTVKATALRVGQTLRLPPATDESDEPHAFFAWRLDELGRGALTRVGPQTRLRDLTHGFVLLAAPLSIADEAEREWRDAASFSAPLPRVEGTARSGLLAKPRSVRLDDLTERVLQTVTVESIVGNTIRTARSAQSLDGKGRSIAPIAVPGTDWATLLFTVLGVIGAAVLLFVGARRLELATE